MTDHYHVYATVDDCFDADKAVATGNDLAALVAAYPDHWATMGPYAWILRHTPAWRIQADTDYNHALTVCGGNHNAALAMLLEIGKGRYA